MVDVDRVWEQAKEMLRAEFDRMREENRELRQQLDTANRVIAELKTKGAD